MSTQVAIEQNELFIGGEWIAPASDKRIEVISPNTEELVGSVPEGNEQDIDNAVAAARKAFDDPTGWSTWEAGDRAEAMERLADAYEARSEEFAMRVGMQNGMPISVARQLEAVFPPVLLRYYAGLAREMGTEEMRDGLMGGKILVQRKPIGVVGAIVPWNFPQALLALKMAPGLAAGCTMVFKPSPETVLDSFLLAEIIDEVGLPPGVVNIVPADREAGAHLVSHPGVDKVAFTGSTAAGRKIAEVCGRLLRPVTLELGGKSATIVLDDAELADNVEDLFAATLLNNGQTCYLGTRVLAPRARYDEVVEMFSGLASGLKVGDTREDETQIGPMATSKHRDRVEGYIAKGKEEGARVAVGGGRPEHQDKGWFVEPTIFADVSNDHTIAREEIFGPVLALIPYENDEEAIAIANDSDYGLGGSVWTKDIERGEAVARRVQTGSIGINHYMLDPAAPFGGIKDSGLGKEMGPEGLAAYQQMQSVFFKAPAQ